MKTCALEAKYNECPDLREGQVCGRTGEERCGMQEPDEPKPVYQREPRWYEKYYEDKSRRI